MVSKLDAPANPGLKLPALYSTHTMQYKVREENIE